MTLRNEKFLIFIGFEFVSLNKCWIVCLPVIGNLSNFGIVKSVASFALLNLKKGIHAISF